MSTTAILTIKRFSGAHKRLADEGYPPEFRSALAHAMATDVLTEVSRSKLFDTVIVVSGETRMRPLVENLGLQLIDDPDEGHAEAAKRGIEAAMELGATRVALLAGDCPLIDIGEVDLIAREPGVTVISDGLQGTNGLILDPADAIEPSFGPGSRARHVGLAEAASMSVRVIDQCSCTRDVDTGDDLRQLNAKLRADATVAPATREVMATQAIL